MRSVVLKVGRPPGDSKQKPSVIELNGWTDRREPMVAAQSTFWLLSATLNNHYAFSFSISEHLLLHWCSRSLLRVNAELLRAAQIRTPQHAAVHRALGFVSVCEVETKANHNAPRVHAISSIVQSSVAMSSMFPRCNVEFRAEAAISVVNSPQCNNIEFSLTILWHCDSL